METVSFTVDLARKVETKEIKGNIVTRDGRTARIICYDRQTTFVNEEVVALIMTKGREFIQCYDKNGRVQDDIDTPSDLFIELIEEKEADKNIESLGNSKEEESKKWCGLTKGDRALLVFPDGKKCKGTYNEDMQAFIYIGDDGQLHNIEPEKVDWKQIH